MSDHWEDRGSVLVKDGPDGSTLLLARCRAWTGGKVCTEEIRVEEDGSVLAWDPIAGHWTRGHALAERTQRRFRAIAGVVLPSLR